jgi:hypothetical protein
MDEVTEYLSEAAEYQYVPPRMYIVELTREDAINLVHAAHTHAEGLLPIEAKRLVDSANRLASQTVHYS